MTQQAFISISFSNFHRLTDVLQTIKNTLTQANITPHVFVEKYTFAPDQSHQMMQTACREIQESDLLIAELTHKAIGVGIEIGYAAALNKPIIYLRHITAEHSTTTEGIATHIIIYESTTDLSDKLSICLNTLSQSPPVD